MPNIQLSNNLRYLRKEKNLKQNDISEMLNISRQAYSNYETKKRTPDLDSLLILAEFYRVSLNDLVLRNLESAGFIPVANREGIAEGGIPYVFSVNKNTDNVIYLTDEEELILTKLRSSSFETRQIIVGFLSANS